ncbi:MAG: hypothetical protein R2697_05225 [Ilumatobacteraceae bacterium]
MERLGQAGARVDMIGAGGTLGKLGSRSSARKIPYILVVTATTSPTAAVGVNPRGGESERSVDVGAFVTRFTDEVAQTTEQALTA